MGMGSRALLQRAQEQANLIHAVNTIAKGALVPVPGGVLLMDCATLLGAVGVSGDLVRYVERFSIANRRQMQLNLPTSHPSMESIQGEFMKRYGQYREYSSDILDLVPGRSYSGPFISILSRSYTNRSGGISSHWKDRTP